MRIIFFCSILLLMVAQVVARDDVATSPLSQAIARTPQSVSVSLTKTARAMDGGSILNDIRFSDGRLYRLSLDFPFNINDEVIHPDIHFTIFEEKNEETLEHASAAEKRLIQLLEALIAKTKDPHEKKNAESLLIFLKDRKRGFPMGRKWWDFTPWSLNGNSDP